MRLSPKSLATALFGLALVPFAAAVADDQHHQPDTATEAPSTMPSPQVMMMMPMMNMMGQGGMGIMGQSAMPMAGTPMQDMGAHFEGRIAFLRAELGITEAQAPQWDAIAQALRDSTAKLKQAQTATPQAAAATFLQRAEFQEQWLGARLEGLKEIKTAFTGLQAVLSEDQKKSAETLLTQPFCLGQMGMM